MHLNGRVLYTGSIPRINDTKDYGTPPLPRFANISRREQFSIVSCISFSRQSIATYLKRENLSPQTSLSPNISSSRIKISLQYVILKRNRYIEEIPIYY